MKVEREQVCPLLGTRANPDTHFAYATLENRCYAHHRVSPLTLDEQETYCLSGNHRNCRFFLAHQARLAATQVAEERMEAASAPVQTRHPNPLWFLVAALGFVFLCGVLIALSGLPQNIALAMTPAPTATPTRTPTRTNTPTPLPPTGTPIPPTNTPSAATATPSLLPSATPIIYIVQAGDTPGSIAAKFGITAQQLMAANGITDARTLRTGQRLVIPLPQASPTPKR